MMDRYVRVDQKKGEPQVIQDNEVRIMSSGKMRNYITYATTLISEKKHEAVQLKAMGRAINKTVTIAEIIKRRVPGLHQNTQIGSVGITDTWEPLEEGLDRMETTRHVSVITITLSTVPLDASSSGYQEPLAEDLVKPLQNGAENSRPRQNGPGRGIRGENGEPRRGDGGFRGRGRGRAGRGGGRRGPPPVAAGS